MITKNTIRQRDNFLQGWEFAHSLKSLIAHSLITHLRIRSNRSGQMSESLRSLMTKEQRRQPFAQVSHDKGANERIACFFRSLALSLTKNEHFAQKI